MRALLRTVLALALGLGGCTAVTNISRFHGPTDGGPTRDAVVASEGGPAEDARVRVDGGLDAGTVEDAGPLPDASPPGDGGPPHDDPVLNACNEGEPVSDSDRLYAMAGPDESCAHVCGETVRTACVAITSVRWCACALAGCEDARILVLEPETISCLPLTEPEEECGTVAHYRCCQCE